PGGMAAGGMGMGMGFAMANQMGGQMGQQASGGPPPPPPAQQFHVAVDGQTRGPYDLQTLRNQVQSGQLSRDSHVWSQGMDGWQPAGQIEALQGLFAATPPPPPPPVAPSAPPPDTAP